MQKFLMMDDDAPPIIPREFINRTQACQALQTCLGSLIILDTEKTSYLLESPHRPGGGWSSNRIEIKRRDPEEWHGFRPFRKANSAYAFRRQLDNVEGSELKLHAIDGDKGHMIYGITLIKLIGGSAFMHIDKL